jgi:hypothetical protein
MLPGKIIPQSLQAKRSFCLSFTPQQGHHLTKGGDANGFASCGSFELLNDPTDYLEKNVAIEHVPDHESGESFSGIQREVTPSFAGKGEIETASFEAPGEALTVRLRSND